MPCYRNNKKIGEYKFLLKLSWEVVVCIEGILLIFLTYSFYFNYFYFILSLKKIINSLQKSRAAKASTPHQTPSSAWIHTGTECFSNKHSKNPCVYASWQNLQWYTNIVAYKSAYYSNKFPSPTNFLKNKFVLPIKSQIKKQDIC